MSLTTEFVPLELSELRRQAAVLKHDGWRFIQTHAVNTDEGVDLYYSFMKDGHAVNYWVQGVQKGTPVPSITDMFLAAFVFENEARELFGVDMRDIAIDFAGAMYAPAENEPMRFITPAQKAAREKARAAAAKTADKHEVQSADAAPASGGAAPAGRVFRMTPELQSRLDAKLPTLSDEKRARVEAALKARAAEAQAAEQAKPMKQVPTEVPESVKDDATASGVASVSKAPAAKVVKGEGAPESASAQPALAAARDTVLEAKIAALDPDKAAKVRAALSGYTGRAAANVPAPKVERSDDAQLEALLDNMDDAKAAAVRAALAAKGGE